MASSYSTSTPHYSLPDLPLNSTSFRQAQRFLFHPPCSKPTTTFVCHSTPTNSGSTPTSSLSDQLLPLSHTLLKQNQHDPDEQNTQNLLLSTKPKSTWVNPSRPRPKVLSLNRHRRPPPLPYNPNFTDLPLLSRRLAAVPNDDPDAFSATVNEILQDPPSKETALLILNGLRPWQKAHQFFLWIKGNNFFDVDTIFYNVAMKNLLFGKRFDLVELLAEEMVEAGVELDNITYSTVITCAKRCRQYDRAIYWFERMYKTGLMPDEVTYSAILDVYAKLGKVEEVLSLYERGRASGWTPDAIAFAVLGKMFGKAGDYDGIQYVLQEIKSVGVEPNLVVYNSLLEAMGKAGKPALARNLFEEMLEKGLKPNEKTLTSLIKIYGKARWSRDAMELWERMKTNKWPMDFILYNTLLSMCADLGMEEEAERLFANMKLSARSKPDSWSYTAMVNIYASLGKVEKALSAFEEMLENQVEPNVMSCTCLIQCFGKARRIDEAVRVFNVLMDRHITPDDRLCGCLLSVVAVCKEQDDVHKVLSCIERINTKLVGFVRMLGNENVGYEMVRDELRGILSNTKMEARRPFCNCLIDICLNQNFPSRRAQELFSLGTTYGLYPGLQTKLSTEWSLNLRSLSVGAAYTAFEAWMSTLADYIHSKDALPQLFSVNTGTGSHKLSQGLSTSFASHMEKLASPFQQNEGNSGYFVASREDVIQWIQSRASPSTATT